MAESDKKKIKAIQTLLKHGRRGSEWQEAGLLHAIEKIVNDELGTSSDELRKLMEKAKSF